MSIYFGKEIISLSIYEKDTSIYMKKNNFENFPSVNIIVCFAETIYDWQRDLLENFFQCRVHNQYGLREPVALGGSCEYKNYYQVFVKYSLAMNSNSRVVCGCRREF